MTNRPGPDDIEEGEVPDDEPEVRELQQQQPGRELRRLEPQQESSEIIFETVTDHSIHMEKKKKRIHKEHKDKRTPSATREKERNREKDSKDRNLSVVRNPEKQLLPQPAPTFHHPVYPPPFYPQSHYYAPLLYPHHPAIIPPNAPPPPNYPYQPQHFYSPMGRAPYGMGQLYPQLRPTVPTSITSMQQISTVPNSMVGQVNKIPQGRSNQPGYSREARGNILAENNHLEDRQECRNSGIYHQQERASLKGTEHSERMGEESKKREVREDLKAVVRKQLKGFSPQEQLNILQVIRCLLKYSQKRGSSDQAHFPRSDSQLSKKAHDRSMSMLEALAQENDERKVSIQKLLETLGLEGTVCSWKETRLYEAAKCEQQFLRMAERAHCLLRDPFKPWLG